MTGFRQLFHQLREDRGWKTARKRLSLCRVECTMVIETVDIQNYHDQRGEAP